jgi:hypothetical protein
MALTVKNKASMYVTLLAGVDAPQKMMDVSKHSPTKYP